MYEKRYELARDSSERSRRSVKNQRPAPSPPAPHRNELQRVRHRTGGGSSKRILAEMFKDSPISGLTLAAQTLPDLQKHLGNRLVQRVLNASGELQQDAGVNPELEAEIQRARSSGSPLDSSVRQQMESSLTADFSSVRVHADRQADDLNTQLKARAFTTGNDVFFASGEYKPGSSGGRKLIAHELAHVVQQTGAVVQGRLEVGRPDDRYEEEANQVAEQVGRIERQVVSDDGDSENLQHP